MKKRIIIISIAVIALIVLIILFANSNNKDYRSELQFAQVEQGTIKNEVSCTGAIQAKGTVEVGTQVSGIVAKVYVNYNDHVRKDQVLAQLDPELMKISVQSAQAELLKANSQYEHSLKEYENNVQLYNNKLISEFDLDSFRVSKEASYAAKLVAETALKKAQTNLQYSIIRSPISGTVIDRNIEEGQTVAASLSTPTLFVIAEDLSQMEIHALVDESDIGKIKLNQPVTFTVEAYTGEKFSGKVREIRLQPTTVSNVVNYTVIIDASNEKKLLMPGMTATIDIVTEEKKDILVIANSAVRFQPTDAMLKDLKKTVARNDDASSDGRSNGGSNRVKFERSNNNNGFANGNERQLNNNKNMVQLWYLDENQNLRTMMVRTGLSDGKNTELLANPRINAGMKFINGLNGKTKTAAANSNNSRNRGPGGFMMIH